MSTTRRALLGALLIPLIVAGCGGEPESVPFKPTDTKNLDSMKNAMTDRMKTKNYASPAK